MQDYISRQVAVDAIMGQPPEPHYPSWYAAQIEKLPSAQDDNKLVSEGKELNLEKYPWLRDVVSSSNAVRVNNHFNANDSEPTDAHYPGWYAERLEQLPSAQPEWNNHTVACLHTELFDDGNKWIPCSERLPEEMGTYMTTIDYGKHGLVTGQRYYYGRGLKWNDECVIAWMPLPDPYKAESEQGMNCEDCVYSDIADWEQNKKTGKAKAVYWCERHKKLCNDIQECQFEDNGEK